ncbi:MAG: protein kinase, partial [Anaerolineae bacterium]
MPQMCPGCSRDNANGGAICVYCGEPLLGLLGANAILAGRYRVTRVLGCGGMGAVYLADDLRIAGRQIAVKENLNTLPQAQAQFQTEVNLMAALHHPNLPAVSDQFVAPTGRQYLVMDYIAGETLEDLVMRHGPLPEAEVIALADRLLDVLAYLHSQGVVHRDVKPANVKLTLDGQPVLVDFGIAKLHAAGRPTQTWARGAGSPGFAPIEQYGAGTDARSDLYSLGAVLYYLLTGQVPPAAPDLLSGTPLPPLQSPKPGISIGTLQLVSKAMVLHQAQRYQSAGEMRLALQGLRHGALAQQVSAPGIAARTRRPTAWVLLTGILLIAVVGIVVTLVMRSGAGRPGIVTAVALVTTILTAPPLPSDTPDLRPVRSPEPDLPTVTATAMATAENPATPTAQAPAEPATVEITATPVASATARVEPEPTALPTVTPVPTATEIPPGPTQLTFGTGKDYAPVYHPDGQRIVFFARRSGFWQLYVLVLPSQVSGPLIATGADIYHP